MISRLSCSLTIPNYKSRIVIFGSTGKTGKEVVNSLRSYPNISIVCVVKDLSRGRKLLGPDQPGFSVLPGIYFKLYPLMCTCCNLLSFIYIADLVYDKQSKLENIIQDANSVVFNCLIEYICIFKYLIYKLKIYCAGNSQLSLTGKKLVYIYD